MKITYEEILNDRNIYDQYYLWMLGHPQTSQRTLAKFPKPKFQARKRKRFYI